MRNLLIRCTCLLLISVMALSFGAVALAEKLDTSAMEEVTNIVRGFTVDDAGTRTKWFARIVDGKAYTLEGESMQGVLLAKEKMWATFEQGRYALTVFAPRFKKDNSRNGILERAVFAVVLADDPNSMQDELYGLNEIGKSFGIPDAMRMQHAMQEATKSLQAETAQGATEPLAPKAMSKLIQAQFKLEKKTPAPSDPQPIALGDAQTVIIGLVAKPNGLVIPFAARLLEGVLYDLDQRPMDGILFPKEHMLVWKTEDGVFVAMYRSGQEQLLTDWNVDDPWVLADQLGTNDKIEQFRPMYRQMDLLTQYRLDSDAAVNICLKNIQKALQERIANGSDLAPQALEKVIQTEIKAARGK